MKKLLLIFLILLIPSSLAISTDMKQFYSPGETMIIEIGGNILESIPNDNVELKRKNVQVPFVYDVQKIGGKHFLYGQLPSSVNNFTLLINNIVTTVNGVVQEVDYKQNFSTFGNYTPYTITPGFIIAEGEFSFTIFSHEDFDIPVSLDFPEPHQVHIKPGSNTISFNTFGSEPGLRKIQIGQYSVPALIVSDGEIPPEDLPPTPYAPIVRFFPKTIESIVLYGVEPEYPFSITNLGSQQVEGAVLDYDPDLIKIRPQSIGIISPNETIEFTLTLNYIDEPVNQIIALKFDDYVIEMPIIVTYTSEPTDEFTPYLDEENPDILNFYCQEVLGEECSNDEFCEGDEVETLDVVQCCLGLCMPLDEGGGFAWLGYLIVAVVLIILIIVGGRYLKTRRKKNEPLKERIDKAQQQLTPQSRQIKKEQLPKKRSFMKKILFKKQP